VVLRCTVVRTSDPDAPWLNVTPARPPSIPVDGVPRSLIVESTASNRPRADTAKNGRPGESGATACRVAGSAEVTVTPFSDTRPLPV
jgi:hypothetical protein